MKRGRTAEERRGGISSLPGSYLHGGGAIAGIGMARRFLHNAIKMIVEFQVEENDPPETRKTLDRLVAAGHDREEAVQIIAGAITEEVWGVLRGQKDFDRAHFRALLENLH